LTFLSAQVFMDWWL